MSNFSVLLLAEVIVFLCGILTTVLWAHYAPVELYGKYKLLISIITISSAATLPGLETSAIISASRRLDKNFAKILKYRFQASPLGSFIILLAAFLPYRHDTGMHDALLVFAVLFPLYTLTTGIDWLNGRKDFKKIAAINITNDVFILSTLFFLLSVVKTGKLWCIILPVFSIPALINAGTALFAKNTLIQKNTAESDDRIIRYGFHASLVFAISSMVYFDNILIERFLSVRDVAIFAIAGLFPAQIKIIFSIFIKILFPKFSSAASIGEVWKWFKARSFTLFSFFIGIGLAGFLTIDAIIPLLFSQKYAEAAQYGKWLFLTLSITAPFSFLNVALQSRAETKYMYFITLFHSALFIILMVTLLPAYKLWGAVYANVIYRLVGGLSFLVAMLYYKKKEEQGLEVDSHPRME